MTFSLGGLQAWMPQFLFSERHYSLEKANLYFGMAYGGKMLVRVSAQAYVDADDIVRLRDVLERWS